MTRIAILDHSTHTLYIEDIADEELEKFGGEEEAYIKDTYTFEGEFSWDFITGIEYIPEGFDNPVDIEPSDMID